LVLVWLFITATLFHPHFGELTTFFYYLFFFSYRPGSALCGDVNASVVQQLAKHNSQKVTIASNRNSLFSNARVQKKQTFDSIKSYSLVAVLVSPSVQFFLHYLLL
jgi:hypothetical protein